MQPMAEAPTMEALHAFLNLDLALECDGASVYERVLTIPTLA
jgi:hypothetical protein